MCRKTHLRLKEIISQLQSSIHQRSTSNSLVDCGILSLYLNPFRTSSELWLNHLQIQTTVSSFLQEHVSSIQIIRFWILNKLRPEDDRVGVETRVNGRKKANPRIKAKLGARAEQKARRESAGMSPRKEKPQKVSLVRKGRSRR